MSRPALAQSADETVLVDTFAPPGFGADLTDIRAIPPAYAPVGMRAGAFQISSQLNASNGVTSNTYLTQSDRKASAFYTVAPSIGVRSLWSRHAIGLRADAQKAWYVGESRRKEDNWNVATDGRLDISRALRVRYEASASLQTRNRLSGDLPIDGAIVSTYRQDALALDASYTSGRVQISVGAQAYDIRYRPLSIGNGQTIDRTGENRAVRRVEGQVQYALSPSLGVYVQGDMMQIDFDRTLLGTVRDSDSTGGRALAGVEVNIPGYATATVGVGYSVRDYKVPGLKSTRGLSAEASLRWDLTRLTVVTLQAGRRISNSAIVSTDPYTQIQAGARVDHSLRRNILLSYSLQYFKQDYVGTTLKSSSVTASLSGRYLVSRRVELGSLLSYSTLSEKPTNQFDVRELRGSLRLTLRL